MRKILSNTLAVLDKKEKKQFLFLAILDILISVADILSLVLLLWIIQFYVKPDYDRDLSFLPWWLASPDSIGFIAVFFVFFSLKNLAAYLVTRSQHAFSSRVAIRISRDKLLDYQRAGFGEFVNTDSSIHIRRICFQPFEFCQYILSGIQQIITQVFLIGLTILAIVLFNARLFLILLLILLPPVIAVFYFVRKRLHAARAQIRSNNESSFRHLLDALKGWVESNIYNRNDFFLRRFVHYRAQFSRHLFNSITIQHMPQRIIEVFAVLGLFILIVIAKWAGSNDSTTFITIGAFMAAAYKIIPGMVKLVNLTGQIKTYEFSIDELAANQSMQLPDPAPADTIESIEFRKVRFHYDSRPVLNGIDLSVKAGDFAGISGASGKGKTTLLNLLLGFLEPAGGEILINGEKTAAAARQSHWPSIAYVKQQPFLIHDTVLRNITLEENGHDTETLGHAIKVSGLDELIGTSGEGLDKMITENGKNISGGQQQRITIARALYKKARVILLDEPFNELDEISVNNMLSHFSQMAAAGKIVIMITHDRKSLSYCNKIISLDE